MKSFEMFMVRVNAELRKMQSLTADSLPDYGYMNAFNLGWSAKYTAKRALHAAQYSF